MMYTRLILSRGFLEATAVLRVDENGERYLEVRANELTEPRWWQRLFRRSAARPTVRPRVFRTVSADPGEWVELVELEVYEEAAMFHRVTNAHQIPVPAISSWLSQVLQEYRGHSHIFRYRKG